ncbi:hypothetical protein ACFLWA_06665 [Chloroflexota bacterium]
MGIASSRLSGPEGVYYCLYVILDMFSRFVPGWMIAERELAQLAEQLKTVRSIS